MATYFQIWLGKTQFSEALAAGPVEIDAIPTLADAFLDWFTYSPAAATVRAIRDEMPILG